MRKHHRTIFEGVAATVACLLAWHAQPATAQSVQYVAAPRIEAVDAPNYARYYAPYAIQALAAYRPIRPDPKNNEPGLDSTISQPPRNGYGADVNYAVIADDFGDQTDHARKLLSRWHYRFGHEGYLGCIDPKDAACERAVKEIPWWAYHTDTLAFQVWEHARYHHNAKPYCDEASIAFRGSAFLSDWASNFHQLFGSQLDDSYDQLGRNIDAIIRKIHCSQIVSVGHSLGGALAQFAALANSPNHRRIRKVFAFNSSPITSASLIDAKTLQENSKGLTIDRIQQKEELLSTHFARYQQYPSSSSACNPLVRTVEFDVGAVAPPPSEQPGRVTKFVRQVIISRVAPRTYRAYRLHQMAPLATKLVEWSYDDNVRQYSRPPSTSCPTDYEEPKPGIPIGTPVAGLGAEGATFASGSYYGRATRANQYDATQLFAIERNRTTAKPMKVRNHKIAMPVGHKGKRIQTAKS